MTTYYIRRIEVTLDSSKGDGTLSVPPFLRFSDASEREAVIPQLTTTSQRIYGVRQPNVGYPSVYTGYGYHSSSNKHGLNISSDGTTLFFSDGNGSGLGPVSTTSGNKFVTYPISTYYFVATCMNSTGSKLYGLANDDKGYYSDDSGETWTEMDTSINASVLCMTPDGTRIYRAYSNDLYYSENNGASWTQILNSGDGLGEIHDVACSEDGQYILLAANKICVSTDDGDSFTEYEDADAWNCVCMGTSGEYMWAGRTTDGKIFTTPYPNLVSAF